MQKLIILGFFVLFLAAALLISSCSINNDSITASQLTVTAISAPSALLSPPGLNTEVSAVSLLFVTDAANQPVNPAGPLVELTLMNNTNGPVEPIVSLQVTIFSNFPTSFYSPFNFDVSPSNPLLPGETISSTVILVGYSNNITYALDVVGKTYSGKKFTIGNWPVAVPFP